MASQLSGPNIEEEYLWSVTLDAKTKEYLWSPKDPADDETEEEDDPSCKPNHRLLVKTALLHPDAKKDDVTMLQIETKGYKDEKVVTPFLVMKSGGKLQQYVDLLLPDSATIKIIQGEGPITLVGSHCVDFYDYRNYGGDETLDEDEDAESSEDDEMDMEEQETVNLKEDKEEDKKKSEEADKKTPKKDTPKKDSAKKDSAKKETPKKEAEKAQGKSPKSEGAAKKTPESKKRKSSEDASVEKKRKKSGEK